MSQNDFTYIAEQNMLKNACGASGEEIRNAEKLLGVVFAADYRTFLSTVGASIGCGHEIIGICAFSDMSVVPVTQEARISNPTVPQNWYVIEQAHIDSIMIWQDETGAVYQTQPNVDPVKVASGLLEYMNSDQ